MSTTYSEYTWGVANRDDGAVLLFNLTQREATKIAQDLEHFFRVVQVPTAVCAPRDRTNVKRGGTC